MGLLGLNGALGPTIMTAQDFDAIPVPSFMKMGQTFL